MGQRMKSGLNPCLDVGGGGSLNSPEHGMPSQLYLPNRAVVMKTLNTPLYVIIHYLEESEAYIWNTNSTKNRGQVSNSFFYPVEKVITAAYTKITRSCPAGKSYTFTS